MVHLHARSWYSFRAASSSPETLVRRAAEQGQKALAVTDCATVSGVVSHARACEQYGIKPIYGVELIVDDYPLVFLALNKTGFANMCDLITAAHSKERGDPRIELAEIQGHTEGLVCLTGGREGRLACEVREGSFGATVNYLKQLKMLFGENLYIELVHHRRWRDDAVMYLLCELARSRCVKTIASNDVRYAAPEGMPLYDALICARFGQQVEDSNPERPINAEAYIRSEQEMIELGFPQDAINNTIALAEACNVELKPEGVTPPSAWVPEGMTAAEYLIELCHQGMPARYGAADSETRAQAETLLKKELGIITQLKFEEFFLAVREVMEFARSRDIICSGRGSAANSIVAYLLHITYVDPIKNHLLFERFLHEGRKGMPDIDCDFPSDRRDEVIEWMNTRWSDRHTAMTANIVTYRIRGAVREMMKVMGWPESKISRATKELDPWSSAAQIREHRDTLAAVVGEETGLEVLLSLVEQMHDCPQYLGLHSGGMLLSHEPLRHLTGIQTSAKGVRQIQFNKDDVEWLGATKFDVLSLRMLGALAMARDLVRDCKGTDLDLDKLPFDDPKTYELLRTSKTLGLFQIESPGQMRLLSMTQPERFTDLIPQVALFRPGPLQGNMVNPFCLRRRGLQGTSYMHPSLIPVLKDTYGIILYQEQVLEVAHVFANMSLSEADDFRKLMSKFRSHTEMEAMRGRFVEGAIAKHKVHPKLANAVFDTVSKFVGYGFCRSHAAAFARIVEQSAYLKAHYPDAYLAAVMEHEPGFYPRQTFVEEARRNGIKVVRPCLNRSGAQYTLEDENVIRVSLARVHGISPEAAASVVLERDHRPFDSLEDAISRCELSIDDWENLARSDALADFGVRREELWKVRQYARVMDKKGQIKLNFETPISVPDMPAMTREEAMEWDYATTSFTTGPHPIAFRRSRLNALGVMRICQLESTPAQTRVRIAGIVSVRMRPPTAKGMCFITLQDETADVQTAITPETFDQYARVLRQGAMIFEGILQDGGRGSANTYRAILVEKVWAVDSAIGGAQGHTGQNPRQVVETGKQRIRVA